METYDITSLELDEQLTVVVRGHVRHDGIGAFLGEAFGEVTTALAKAGARPCGSPFARYDLEGDGFAVEAGFPVDTPFTGSGQAVQSSLPGGRAAKVLHRGSYAEVVGAYQAAEQWVVDHGLRQTSAPWEVYLDGPDVPEPRTEVVVPCGEPSGT